MKIRWTEHAVGELLSIGRYVAHRDVQAARRLVARLRSSIKRLSKHPFSGRMVPEFERDELREVIELHYRIVYLVKEKEVLVLSVFDSHREFPEEIPDEAP